MYTHIHNTYIHSTHTYIHTYYAPIHIYHMYTLVPISHSTHHYHTLYIICLYTHTLTTYTTYHTHTLIYTHPCYMPMLIYNIPYMTHCNIHSCYICPHSIYALVNVLPYITTPHICHTQAHIST